ncbi:von Willebrand factor type A domain-containing protein [Rhodococcus rhodochrous J3]|uniref:von Willebrand factor type A domain-containing protein n=1 Tax=Rhodococcus rhodochrous J3 TaxID=903528 RepID=A0ABY1MGH7_RHORH|nr:substrate-binding domain-containing protein [Rhodococcus rhodochrous]MBF4476534.1 substrate-binding domain-containing protein [Rhodococcus rhodochrous]MCB8908673.1 substrate-binding and VWA domain-containing protein [Rhodococcus rhodochrous]MDJ0400637.1 substrate-binding domain-containing protein [Rhodococcus rhodochrous]SMG55094.1 von Willebrand factor type A domain-containing protein [Rhodococcus rhodochrous J3]
MSGRHRGSGRRGISTSVIVVAVGVVLALLAVLGWFRLRDNIDNQATAAAETCVEGDTVLHIAADPLIAPALTELAEQWTDGGVRVIRDHCVTAEITAVDSLAAADTLGTDTWDPALGPEPALWVPLDTRMSARAADAIDGTPRSLATSPVVLAVPTDLGRALTTATVRWQDLPRLQNDPAAMRESGLDIWGTLGLALPTGTETHATTLALEAVTAATTGIGAGPVTLEQAATPAAITAVSTLALGADTLGAVGTTADTLAALGAHPDTAAPIHAVPVIEQQLHRALTDGQVRGLTGHLPIGVAPVVDFPTAVVDAPWVDETLARAAAEFTDYARRPEQAGILTAHGFRTADAVPEPAGELPLPRVDTVLAPADPTVDDVLVALRLAPVSPRKVTMVVDTSTSMGTSAGDGTRLTATAGALREAMRRASINSVMGMYVFADTPEGHRVAVIRDGLTAAKRAAMSSILDDIDLVDREPVYATLTAAYRDAVDNYDPGRPNSVLVVVDSDDPDEAAARDLRAAIDELSSPETPVRIDVVVLGDRTDPVLEQAAEATDGSLTVVDTTDPADLTDLLRKLTS